MWVPDPEHCFLPAKILASNGHKHTVLLEDGSERTVDAGKGGKKGGKKGGGGQDMSSELGALKRSSLQRIVPDLVLLDDMSPPLILHCLKKRFLENKIYVCKGCVGH